MKSNSSSLSVSPVLLAVTALLGIYLLLDYDESARSFDKIHVSPPDDGLPANVERADVFWKSGDTRIHGWLYTPTFTYNSSIIIMAAGLGGQKDFGINRYAERFASEGFTVLTFDYRGWGGSEGMPRHVADHETQLQDWSMAVSYAIEKLRGGDNTTKIGLWGFSFSGGHVLYTAAMTGRRSQIGAVIAVNPMTNGIHALVHAVKQSGWMSLARMSLATVKDVLRNALGWPRYYVKIMGTPEETAVLSTKGTKELYGSLVPSQGQALGGWQNKMAASILLRLPFYLPCLNGYRLDHTPTLLMHSESDNLVPSSSVVECATRHMNPATTSVEALPVHSGHFGVFHDDFESTVERHIQFYRQHLRP